MTDKIKTLFIFEILGRPPEHIKETMSQLVDKLGELPGIEISRKTVHEPKAVEDKDAKDLFTTFAEVEILGKDLNSLMTVVFHAMPSHIEIIEPEEIRFKNFEMSSLLSDLTIKMHRYDEIAKAITMERNMLIGKLKELGVTFTTPKQQAIQQAKQQQEKKSENKAKEKPIDKKISKKSKTKKKIGKRKR